VFVGNQPSGIKHYYKFLERLLLFNSDIMCCSSSRAVEYFTRTQKDDQLLCQAPLDFSPSSRDRCSQSQELEDG
jgi:hypothetical protein